MSLFCCGHEADEEIEELSETFSGFSDKEYPFGFANWCICLLKLETQTTNAFSHD